jgi:hypothetical protein
VVVDARSPDFLRERAGSPRVRGLNCAGDYTKNPRLLTTEFTLYDSWIEPQTGWSIRKFVKPTRRYRTIEIHVGQHTIAAAAPVPDDLRQALDAINRPSRDMH